MFIRTLFFLSTIALSTTLVTALPRTKPQIVKAQAHHIKTLAQYNAAFNSTKPMVALYTGIHCGPCKIMLPLFKRVAAEHGNVQFCLIETSNPGLKNVFEELEIKSVPTLIFSHKGKRLRTEVGGATLKEIEQWVSEFEKQISEPKKVTPQPKKTANKGCPVGKKRA